MNRIQQAIKAAKRRRFSGFSMPSPETIHANRLLSSLPFRIHDQGDEVIAATKAPEEAAMLLSALGSGYRMVYEGQTVWSEGRESQPAAESYDHVAGVVYGRIG